MEYVAGGNLLNFLNKYNLKNEVREIIKYKIQIIAVKNLFLKNFI